MNATFMTLVMDWLVENAQRLFSKSPVFYKVYLIAGALVTVAPLAINTLYKWGLLDTRFTQHTDDIMYWCGILTMFFAKIAQAHKINAVTKDGNLLVTLDEKKTPFSAKIAVKKAAKMDIPVVDKVMATTTDVPPEITNIPIDQHADTETVNEPKG